MTSKETFIRFTTLIMLMAALALSAAAQTGGSTAHLTEAVTLKDNLLLSGQNTYNEPNDNVHLSSYIVWNGAQSQAFTDCSSFLTLLLKHTYNLPSNYYPGWFGGTVNNPNAAKYHDAIEAGNRFTQLFDLSQVLPGDVIAIKYLSGGTSGHVMLVETAPVWYANYANGSVLKIGVLDSCRSFHDASSTSTDSRYGTNAGQGGGVGRGDFLLYVNASGAVEGYQWSMQSGTPYYAQSERHLVIGRLH